LSQATGNLDQNQGIFMTLPAASSAQPPTTTLVNAANLHASNDEPDDDANRASTLTEAPETQTPHSFPVLKRHDFPDGGGSGGAEAFRRKD
jgi:hypothetical protein